MKIYELKQKKSITFEITGGSSGNVVMTIDGVDYTEAWGTSDDASAIAFVAQEAAAILAASDVVVTNPTGAELLFVSNTSGRVFNIAAAPTGDVTISAGVATKEGSNIELFTSAIANGGNLTIMEIKNFGDVSGVNYVEQLNNNIAEHVAYVEVLRREVKHESELVTYATDNDFTLVRKENDGSDSSSLRAEA